MTPSPPTDECTHGPFEDFLKSLQREVQPLICISLLKMLSIHRQLNTSDGERLKALACLEVQVLNCMTPGFTNSQTRTVYDSPSNPQFS